MKLTCHPAHHRCNPERPPLPEHPLDVPAEAKAKEAHQGRGAPHEEFARVDLRLVLVGKEGQENHKEEAHPYQDVAGVEAYHKR
jgi:hypothetical protein